jgi:hypothetical protein
VPVTGKVRFTKPVTVETFLGDAIARYVEVARCISVPSISVNFAVRAASAMMLKYLKENTISLMLVLNVQERCKSAIEEPFSDLRHHAIAMPFPAGR